MKANNSESVNDNELFYVDPLSNMSNTGELVWDKQLNVPFDCILTKTDIAYGMYGMHNFYKMQLIKQKFTHVTPNGDSKGETAAASGAQLSSICILFTRWGRIGDSGQYQRTPFSNIDEAKAEFFKIFKQKTGNDFEDCVLKKKKEFEHKTKKYFYIEIDTRRKRKLKDIQVQAAH